MEIRSHLTGINELAPKSPTSTTQRGIPPAVLLLFSNVGNIGSDIDARVVLVLVALVA